MGPVEGIPVMAVEALEGAIDVLVLALSTCRYMYTHVCIGVCIYISIYVSRYT